MKRTLLAVSIATALTTVGTSAVAQTASSRLELFLVNAVGDVDGVLLRDGRAMFFAPDVGRTVAVGLRLGDPLRLDFQNGRRFLVNERDQSTFDLTPPARGGGPVGTPALQRVSARGHIGAFLRPPGGALVGFVLTSGEQVRVPPSLSNRLASLRPGDIVSVQGLGNRGRWGLGIEALNVTNANGDVLIQR